jgi:hypothetical protein
MRPQPHSRFASSLSRVSVCGRGVLKRSAAPQCPGPAQPRDLKVVYSRFSLHAVNAATADHLLRWSHENLADGGLLFIETRSVLSSLYGVGDPGTCTVLRSACPPLAVRERRTHAGM